MSRGLEDLAEGRESERAVIARVRSRALGRAARLYLNGGASAILEGWRASTVDVDLRFEPDDELLRALPGLKERLGINIELVSPPDFVPELPGWRERSPLLSELYRYPAIDPAALR